LGFALLGLLATWRWERAGALANITVTTPFTLGLIAKKGLHFPFFRIEGALAAFGLMFLSCWWSDRRRSAALSHP
jgi:hypothetical protein